MVSSMRASGLDTTFSQKKDCCARNNKNKGKGIKKTIPDAQKITCSLLRSLKQYGGKFGPKTDDRKPAAAT